MQDLLYQAWYLDDGALAGKYECRDLLYQAWYLDNGALAGNCPAVIQVSRFGRRLSSKIDEDLCLGLPVWPTKLDFCLCQSLLAISSPLPWAQVYTWSPMRSKSAVHEIGILLCILPGIREVDSANATLLGSPIGDTASISDAICAKTSFLKLLAVPKLLYCLRHVPASSLKLFDDELRSIICSVFNLPLDSLLNNSHDPISKARLVAVSSKESGIWLNVTPVTSLGLHLDNTAVRIAMLGLRLWWQCCKHRTNDPKCSELGWKCIPPRGLPVSCWGAEAGDSLSHAGVLRLGDSLSHAGVLRLGDSLSHAGVLRLGDSLSHAGVLRLGDSLSHAGVLRLGDSLSHAGVLRLGDSLSHAGVLGLGTPCLVSRLAAPMWCTKSPGYCCHLWQTHLTLEADQEYTDTEADPKELKTRQNIYEELVTTERDYVTDMQHVISSYYDEMSPEIVALPARLRGKRYDVFCNITDIHAFHSSTFLGALQSWETNPIRVGESFLKHAAAFQDLYSAYCKNKAHSETVMSESAECEAFFREIQVRLNDKLPLSSYLIKPVQRITKYQLLLKDLIKHTAKATKAQADLRMALDKMLKVLQTLNDSLKAVGLKGYPGTLAEQGKLLLQDRFRVFESTDTKFSRGRDRHVFLFEKVLICSKKMEVEESQKKGKKSEAYVYKDHIQMAEIAIREQMGDHSLNFELMVHGQQRLIKFQAFSKDIKELWVSEMRRLLQLQFTLIKDMVVKSGTLDRMVYKGQAKEAINTKLAVADSCVKAPKSKSIKDFLKPGIKKSSEATPTVKASKLDITSSLVLTRNKAVACPEASLQISRNKSPDATDSFSSDEECSVGDNDEDDTLATEDQYESLAPGVPRIYKAICDYSPSSAENGIMMQIGQTVEVIGINQYGWWWVRLLSQETESTREGWVPASYLQVSKEMAIKKP
eukprot:Em0021g120a